MLRLCLCPITDFGGLGTKMKSEADSAMGSKIVVTNKKNEAVFLFKYFSSAIQFDLDTSLTFSRFQYQNLL